MKVNIKGKIYDRPDNKAPDGEQKYSCDLSLTLALHGSGWLASRLSRITPEKRAGMYRTGECVDNRAGLEVTKGIHSENKVASRK